MNDNRTNEQIVAEAMVDAGAPLMHSRVEEAVVAALRAAGRLAGEPTEAQAEAAAQEEWAEDERRRMTEELRQIYVDMSQLRDRMRALFPSLQDPLSCGNCGGMFIRGDKVAPMNDLGKLKHLRCEGGPR